MATDILVFAPHPDDAELCCGGLLLKARRAGMSVAIVDVTRGEMGTRGTVSTRVKETAAASKMLGVRSRENLSLRDGHLADNEALRTLLVRMLRKYRPALLLTPHWEDQHPDHAAVGQASQYAAFLSGVPKFDPRSAKNVATSSRLPYRPAQVLHYNNRYLINADLVIDITEVMEKKIELVRCYQTQFGPGKTRSGPQTKLSHHGFFDWLRGMHSFYGYQCGFEYGEAYCSKGPLRLSALNGLIPDGKA